MAQGSAGNVIAALASFFIPGLGQLLQGRILLAAVQFVLAAILWLIWLGWIIHLWSIRWMVSDIIWAQKGFCRRHKERRVIIYGSNV